MLQKNANLLTLHSYLFIFSQEPIWYGILNSSYSRLKPQLLVGLSLEFEETQQSSQAKGHTNAGTKSADLILTLDASGGFYQLGPDGTAQQEMFTLSLTLQNAKQLPPVRVLLQWIPLALGNPWET